MMIRFAIFALSLLFLAACTEEEPAPAQKLTTTTAEPAAPEPELIEYTSGTVELSTFKDALRGEVEVLVVSEIDRSTRAQLNEQLTLFMAQHGLKDPNVVGQEYLDSLDRPQDFRILGEEKLESYRAQLDALKESVPPIVKDPGLGLESSTALRSELANYITHLDVTKLAEHLTKTVEILKEKQASLEEVAYDDSQRNEKQAEAQLSLIWLRNFIDHLKKIRSLHEQLQRDIVNTYNRTAQQDARDAEAKARAVAEPFQRWDDFKYETLPTLKINVIKNRIDAVPLGEDGSFTVKGQGTLILRMELEEDTLYWPEDSDALAIKITDRKEWTEPKPTPTE